MSERLIDRVRSIAEWEKAHPELARAWTEALAEKRERDRPARQSEFIREQEAQTRSFLLSCGLGPRATDLLLSGAVRYRPAVRAVSAFIEQLDKPEDERKTFLLLSAKVGSVKTTASGGLFLALGKTPYHHPDLGAVWEWTKGACQYHEAPALARSDHYSADARRAEGRLKACRALVIDELGSEVFTEPWLSRFEEIINARYKNGLPTILATNMDRARFSELYGVRIWRRVKEEGMSPPLTEDESRAAS
jgi:hypothetical protein